MTSVEQPSAQRPGPPPSSRARRVLRQVVEILTLATIVLVGRASLADHYVVPTGSMEPTVQVGDRLIVDKRAYGLRVPLTERYLVHFDGPRRGDVVVLASPEDGEVLLKRVVAVPGDRVAVRGGQLLLDDVPAPLVRDGRGISETLGGRSHSVSLRYGGGPDFGPVTLPADRYLLMGDNRGNSHDGRGFGFVHRDAIFGRAVRTYLREGSFTWRPL